MQETFRVRKMVGLGLLEIRCRTTARSCGLARRAGRKTA